MNFNKEKHIEKMKPHVDKLVNSLKKDGISFEPTDGEFENVVFKSSSQEVKISKHSFYRFSGIACVYKDKGSEKSNESEAVEVTDSMFVENFMKPIVKLHFGLK